MSQTDRFAERIGAVFLPEADLVADAEAADADASALEGPPGAASLDRGGIDLPVVRPPFKLCRTTLKQGCYTLSFTPSGTPIFGTRFRGTLRVELLRGGPRISGDLYRYRLLDDIVVRDPLDVISRRPPGPGDLAGDEAADTLGTIPVYRRRAYHSYLKATGARLVSIVPPGAECTFSIDVDEFVYNHPTTGFSGTFNPSPTRAIRFVLKKAPTPDLYSGDAFAGTTKIGTVSIRWVSPSFRRAHLQLNTLKGAVTPPAVGSTTFATIFADAGWDLTVTDGGGVTLPAALAGIDTTACWSFADMHTLMQSVPGYNSAQLDEVWRVHLLAIPGRLGCSRGWMFDSSTGADPNDIEREGSITYSHDGYPSTDTTHYDTAADQQQRNVPRAFLRSAVHEVGHAFNQIHQGFEGGNDNSIMTPTPSVASVLGASGTFPDEINLAFNDTVKRHLRHLPDPAVRPGGMDFFGSAVAAPQADDVSWLEDLEVTVTPSATRVRLGEPMRLDWLLTNQGVQALPVPERVDTEELYARVNVTDGDGRVTFMRPATIRSCGGPRVVALDPGGTVAGSTTLYWGRDGFAFEKPGRHRIEVIVLWPLAGTYAATRGEVYVYVSYPTTEADNEVAAQMLHPEVGRAVAAGDSEAFAVARQRMDKAATVEESHPAVTFLRDNGILAPAPAPPAARPAKKRAAKARAAAPRKRSPDQG